MKRLSPGRRLALGAGIAALTVGVLIAVFAGGGGARNAAHRRSPTAGAGGVTAGFPAQTTGARPSPSGAAPAKPGKAGTGKAPAKPGSGGGARPGRRARRGLLQVAAGYLGITTARLRAEVASGHTLAQIVASRPGRSASGLVDALVAARTAAIHAAVAEGRIDKSVAARRLAQVRRLLANTVARGRLGAPEVIVVALPPAAAYLGEDIKKLRSQLQRGRTLAQIADSTHGRSAVGLVEALVAIRKTALDKLVKAGHLTKQREQALVAVYRARLEARIRQRGR